jgi:hypothetical protein
MNKSQQVLKVGTDLLPKTEGHIFVLDHMHNLALHRKDEENNPVAKEYGPEDRNIKHREESHHKSYNKSFCDCIPERQGNSCYGGVYWIGIVRKVFSIKIRNKRTTLQNTRKLMNNYTCIQYVHAALHLKSCYIGDTQDTTPQEE